MSPGSPQSYSDKASISRQPTCFIVVEESWGGGGGVVNKSLKGTRQHLMRKRNTSPLLKSAVNYNETCAVTPSFQ